MEPETVLQRVKELKEEIAHIQALNEHFQTHLTHTRFEVQQKNERKARLQQILGELASLTDFGR